MTECVRRAARGGVGVAARRVPARAGGAAARRAAAARALRLPPRVLPLSRSHQKGHWRFFTDVLAVCDNCVE